MAVVLVVASTGVPLQSFLERLTGSAITNRGLWQISTKYYEAEVFIQSEALIEENADALAEMDCEALVLFTTSAVPDGWESLKNWFESKRKDKRIAPISLLVSETEEKGSESSLQWSIENGFECIHVCSDSTARDAELEEEGHGTKRVRDALEAHMWPGLHLKGKDAFPTSEMRQPQPNANSEDDFEDDFDRLLAEMTNARERLQNLSDAERREGAANLAMQLVQYFNDD